MIRSVNGSGMKRMALLNDLSCFGKCSLSVAMPILSSYGVETVPLRRPFYRRTRRTASAATSCAI